MVFSNKDDFLLSFLKKCKQRYLHVTLDTCGFVEWRTFKKIVEYVDLVLFDVKIVNEEKHIKYIGKSNKLILENLLKLSKNRSSYNYKDSPDPQI